MADQKRFDPDEYLGLVRSALAPNEREFFKAYLGSESPGIFDYLLPQGRFKQARDLRDTITKNVLAQAIQPRATVEEAQTLFPGFPTPPNARKLGFADAPTGGPPLGPSTPDRPYSGEVGAFAMPEPQVQSALPPMSAPRPAPSAGQPGMGGVTMGSPGIGDMSQFAGTASPGEVPAPSALPERTMITDGQALLPRSFQDYLNAQIQATTHPRAQGGGVTDAALKLAHQQRIGQLRSGEKEQYPGETRDLEQFLGFYDKAPVPGSLPERKLAAEAQTAEAKVPFAAAKEASSLAVDKSQITANTAKAGRDIADAKETNLLMDAKLRKLLADTQLSLTQGGKVGQDLASAEARLRLAEAGKLLDMTKVMQGLDQISPQGAQQMYKHIASTVAPDLDVTGEDPNFIQKLFGITPKTMTVKPKADQPDTAPAPQGPPPTPQSEAPKGDVKAQAKALYDSMKEGEVKTLNGVKYRKRGTKLERVK